jgi:succinate---hydroxymethylglutarate CoA-transferase
MNTTGTTNNHLKSKILKGIRVLDFSRILVGAYSSMMLADLGAEVIKIEPPGGDETRKWGPPFRGDDSLYFLSINRNKKSICMDLKKPESREIALKLIKKSDILLENFTYGKMKQFSLDYDSVKQINEKLIYTTVNSYGNHGPLRQTPSFDLVIQSYVGVMNITGGEETEPYKVGYPMCDILAGSHVYGAIMAGLLHRQFTGQGQYINTSLLEANLFAIPTLTSNFLNAGMNARRRGNDHPTISPYTVFKLKNGDYFSIGVATDKQFKKLVHVLELEKNEEFHFQEFETNTLRLENREKLKSFVQNAIYLFDEKKLFSDFSEHGIPFSKINSMKDIFENNKQIEDLGLVKEIDTENYGYLKYVRNPVSFSEIELEELKSPPSLGKDTREVLKNLLDMKEEEIEILYEKKILL